jgi:hypothetical protein
MYSYVQPCICWPLLQPIFKAELPQAGDRGGPEDAGSAGPGPGPGSEDDQKRGPSHAEIETSVC